MKKFAYVGVFAVVLYFSSSALANELNPGDKTSCKNANAITLEAKKAADAVIWKSSNFSTIPISFGPGDQNSLPGSGEVGMAEKSSVGRDKVVLTKQESFSRGDSLGDISGEVTITNTGHSSISVKCE